MYKTDWISENDIERKWYIVDAGDQILGRLASRVARLLIGKDKVKSAPNMDCGDYVIIINSSDIKLSRGKEKKKMYYRHSGYMGGLKSYRFDQMMEKDPNKVVQLAIKRMLPDTKLRKSMLNRLFIYEGGEHKHEAQQPEEFKF